jgi:8-oxo-dGTP diphosphatase
MSFPEFAGVILRHWSHFLLIQRSWESRHWPHYWGFPGGKKEAEEDLFLTAQREASEEIGITIEEKDIISSITLYANYIDGERKNTLFLFDIWEWIPDNRERKIHTQIGWFTLDDLPTPMIPHVKEWLFALLDGKNELTYNGMGI